MQECESAAQAFIEEFSSLDFSSNSDTYTLKLDQFEPILTGFKPLGKIPLLVGEKVLKFNGNKFNNTKILIYILKLLKTHVPFHSQSLIQ